MFEWNHPKEFNELKKDLKEGGYGELLEEKIVPRIRAHLTNLGFIEGEDFDLTYRLKSIPRIYGKAQKRVKSFAFVHDKMGIRIILKGKFNEPYACRMVKDDVLPDVMDLARKEHLHGSVESVKDYVNNPKDNLYQSIHVIGYLKDSKQTLNDLFEVQIRTQDMHDWAEYGLGGHHLFELAKKYPKLQGVKPAPANGASLSVELLRRLHGVDMINVEVVLPDGKPTQLRVPKGTTLSELGFLLLYEKVAFEPGYFVDSAVVKRSLKNKNLGRSGKLEQGDLITKLKVEQVPLTKEKLLRLMTQFKSLEAKLAVKRLLESKIKYTPP